MSQKLKQKAKWQEQEMQVLKIMLVLGVLGLFFSLLLTILLD